MTINTEINFRDRKFTLPCKRTAYLFNVTHKIFLMGIELADAEIISRWPKRLTDFGLPIVHRLSPLAAEMNSAGFATHRLATESD
jgi:hypothetical protein